MDTSNLVETATKAENHLTRHDDDGGINDNDDDDDDGDDTLWIGLECRRTQQAKQRIISPGRKISLVIVSICTTTDLSKLQNKFGFKFISSCPCCILRWILFFALMKLNLSKCVCYQISRAWVPASSFKRNWNLANRNCPRLVRRFSKLSKLQLTSNKFHERRKITFSQLAPWHGAH